MREIDLKKMEDIWRKTFTRKDFIKKCIAAGVVIGSSTYYFDLMSKHKAFASIGEKRGMREAMFYEKIGEEAVRCLLCPNQCTLSNGQRGFCRVREPAGGKLYTLVYELVCSLHVDPIEKKPLFHVLPGSKAFSIATAGCNSRCKFCQNWTISQRSPEETDNRILSAGNLISSARNNGCKSIAYTYTEPIVFYEYVMNAGAAAKINGILNIIVTGGKINPKPLQQLCTVTDAANVDLKAFDEKYLKEVCAQDLGNILQTLKILKQNGVWVEITNLIVPTLNDNMDTIRKMARWIKSELGAEVPLHFSRFWPQYKLRSLYPTPIETLKEARTLAMEEGLQYVYIGNVPDSSAESTICPRCKNIVIKRIGYRVKEINISDKGICKFCGNNIPGIWG